MYYIGVDLGGTNIAVGIVDKEGKILAKKSVKTLADRPFDEIVADMAKCILDLLAEQGMTENDIVSIGIGCPGNLDTENGRLVYANNFKNGTDIPLRKLMQQHINKPVYLGNDANVAALGETISGAAKGVKNAVMITLGTGVGGGIIIDGKIYEGQNSAGAEMGHVCIVKDGEHCSCGRNGCWEAYASVTALIRQTKEAMKAHPESKMNETPIDEVNGRTAFDAMRAGDAAAKDVCDRYIEYIAEGLVDIVNVFRPETLIIGGGICKEGDTLLVPIKNFINKYAYGGSLNPEQHIEIAKLGNDAGIIGAALIHA